MDVAGFGATLYTVLYLKGPSPTVRGPGGKIYESCACHVSAAHQCRTSLSYSLSVEFVYIICDSPEPLSYRFRRGATPAGLHRALALTRAV